MRRGGGERVGSEETRKRGKDCGEWGEEEEGEGLWAVGRRGRGGGGGEWGEEGEEWGGRGSIML